MSHAGSVAEPFGRVGCATLISDTSSRHVEGPWPGDCGSCRQTSVPCVNGAGPGGGLACNCRWSGGDGDGRSTRRRWTTTGCRALHDVTSCLVGRLPARSFAGVGRDLTCGTKGNRQGYRLAARSDHRDPGGSSHHPHRGFPPRLACLSPSPRAARPRLGDRAVTTWPWRLSAPRASEPTC